MPPAPLTSGSRILNGRTASPGTLGCIGIGSNGEQFLVSAYHVLGRSRSSLDPVMDGEPIWRPGRELQSEMIGVTDLAMMHPRFDIGAARLLPGLETSAEIPSLGPIKGLGTATEGMRVLKYGAQTGVTEGWVTSVSRTLVEIEGDPDAGDAFVLSARGDSGALWVSPDGEAIAMHFQGRDRTSAFARPLDFVLATLGFTLLADSQ